MSGGNGLRPAPYKPANYIVTDFRYLQNLHLVRYVEGEASLFYTARDYMVSFKLDGVDQLYTVVAGTKTDFASIPSIVPSWLLNRLDRHLEAAVVHDRMCIDKGPYDSRAAAEVFLAAMVAADVPVVTRNLMYRAVVVFGPKW